MLTRPAHLRSRTIRRTFGVDATLLRTSGSYNQYGEYNEAEVSQPIVCATAPITSSDARARLLTEGGIQLQNIRLFWHIEDIDTVNDSVADNSPGDIIVFANERYRAKETQRWNGFSETVGIRQEGQL